MSKFEEIQKIIKDEGDYHQWVTEYNNVEMQCSIRRNNSGALCGYVTMTRDNKLWGLDYGDISNMIDFYPHGGLTFASETPSGYTVGFDCAHSGDLCPYFSKSVGIYRDLAFVKNECESLAESLSKHSVLIQRLNNINQVLDK